MDKTYNLPAAVDKGIARPAPWEISDFVTQAAASGSIEFTGTVTSADEITVTLKSQQLPDLEWVWSMALDSETLTQIATALKNAINADPLLDSLGISASSVGAVVTIAWAAGPLGNFATIEFETGVAETETATIVQFSGGAGYVTPIRDFQMVHNGSIIKLEAGKAYQVDYLFLKAMIDAGVSVK